MQLQITDQLFQIIYNKAILRYANPIARQYIFRLKDYPELFAIANSVDTKKEIKLANIEFWYLHIRHLGYRNLKTLKNLSSRIDFKETAPKQLCKNCHKVNQTYWLSKIYIL